jgi:hypothetical protein
VGGYSNADALLDLARGFLNTAPEDRSGEDRTQVVVHVSADSLAGNVPAGTFQPSEATCHIAGIGAVEAATAHKQACDNPLLGAVVDKYGNVLALGRTRRLVSKTLRRALLIRDRMCQDPGRVANLGPLGVTVTEALVGPNLSVSGFKPWTRTLKAMTYHSRASSI